MARLADRRGERVGDALRLAPQRAQRGEAVVPTPLHSVSELEAAARLPGVRGAMAKARLRLLRDPASERVRQDERLEAGGVFQCLSGADALCELWRRPGGGPWSTGSISFWRSMPVLEPVTFATPEDAIAAEVAEVEVELRRIDARIAALVWSGGYARRRTGTLSWSDFALGPQVEHDNGDHLAREVLRSKRETLLHRLGELRSRLTGQDKANSSRRGWG